jgi:serine/threonine-protein kinase RsbW
MASRRVVELQGAQRISTSAVAETVHVRLNLSNSAENVPAVRQALAGFGEAIALEPLQLSDIRTALTEACNNASIHAYAGAEGPMEVELRAGGNEVGVTVRDRGRGLVLRAENLEASPPIGDELPGLGLPAIHSLASTVEVRLREGGGTEIVMSFSTPQIRVSEAGELIGRLDSPWPVDERFVNTVELEMAPLMTARWVFPRVLRAIAARAYFPIDRLADAQRVGGVLLADDDWDVPPLISAGIAATPEGIEFVLGPLTEQRIARLADVVRAVEPSIEILAEQNGGGGAAAEQHIRLMLPRSR